MMFVDQIPGFVAGAVVSAVVSLFVWRNNPALMDRIYKQAKMEELKLEEKVKAILVKLGVKVSP